MSGRDEKERTHALHVQRRSFSALFEGVWPHKRCQHSRVGVSVRFSMFQELDMHYGGIPTFSPRGHSRYCKVKNPRV